MPVSLIVPMKMSAPSNKTISAPEAQIPITSQDINIGLVTPYGGIDKGEHRLKLWVVAERHQATTCTNDDLPTQVSFDIHMRPISQGVLMNLICNVCSEITLSWITTTSQRGHWVEFRHRMESKIFIRVWLNKTSLNFLLSSYEKYFTPYQAVNQNLKFA